MGSPGLIGDSRFLKKEGGMGLESQWKWDNEREIT